MLKNKIERKNIYIGLVYIKHLISYELPHAIFYTSDGYTIFDLYNEKDVTDIFTENKSLSITATLNLDDDLRDLGYPEILSSDDIKILLSNSVKKDNKTKDSISKKSNSDLGSICENYFELPSILNSTNSTPIEGYDYTRKLEIPYEELLANSKKGLLYKVKAKIKR